MSVNSRGYFISIDKPLARLLALPLHSCYFKLRITLLYVHSFLLLPVPMLLTRAYGLTSSAYARLEVSKVRI
jgi:hypothetical protein